VNQLIAWAFVVQQLFAAVAQDAGVQKEFQNMTEISCLELRSFGGCACDGDLLIDAFLGVL